MSGKNRAAWPGLLLVVAMLLVIPGCGVEETPVEPIVEPPETLPFPDSPDQLMANFLALYETMDFGEYRRLLSPDFETHLQQATMEEYPDVGSTLDLDEELRIHERMFSGDDLTDPNGDFIPGVEAVSFVGFKRTANWSVSVPPNILQGTEWAPYDVDFLISRGERYSFLRASGTINFYVAGRDSVHRGATKKYYQMVGQVDWTGFSKSVEDTRWGSLKALFR